VDSITLGTFWKTYGGMKLYLKTMEKNKNKTIKTAKNLITCLLLLFNLFRKLRIKFGSMMLLIMGMNMIKHKKLSNFLKS